MELNAKSPIVEAYAKLLEPHRFKVLKGGRGSGKSHTVARILLSRGYEKKLRILCAREIQKSIKDSVHKLLSDLIEEFGLQSFYTITQASIVGINGTEFMFCGLWQNASEIKSKEGIDYCWVEEAERVSEQSWDYLIPTIRKEESEIWIVFNPDSETDPTYKRFVTNKPDDELLIETTYRDNLLFFPKVLEREMEWCKKTDYDKYLWVWEGQPRNLSDALIFKGKFVVDDFETPIVERYYYGADWGFAQDPTTLIRCFIIDRKLYIDYEAWGVGVELDEIPQLFDSVPESRKWRIPADSSRPETISYIARKGFQITSCDKWTGCVEDGIAFLKSFEQIVIHSRCVHTIQEMKSYCYKKDRLTDEILPIIVDKDNHCIDALRYALESLITKKDFHIY